MEKLSFNLDNISAARQLYFLFEDKVVEAVQSWFPNHDIALLEVLNMTKEGIEVSIRRSHTDFPSQIKYQTGLVTWEELNNV